MERQDADGSDSDHHAVFGEGEGYKVDMEFPNDIRQQDPEGPEPPRLLGSRFPWSTHSLGRSLKQVLPGIHGVEEVEEDDPECRRRSAFFVDVDAMKAKVKANLSVPKTATVDYYKTEGLAQRIARSTVFDRLALVVIACNAAWITVDTDYNDAELLTDAHPAFQIVEHSFCVFFVGELVVRFLAFSRKRNCVRDAWFLFDSLLVLAMVTETWIMTFVVLVFGRGSSSGSLGDTPILKIARLLRLSRMARMARLLRAFPELMIMVKGMLAAMRSVVMTLTLLLIIMYVFGIAFTQLTADTGIGQKFFRSVGYSMYTLALHGTLLDNVRHLTDSLLNESFMLVMLFFIFVLLAAFTVMNMLIGVLCEVVSAVAATEKEEFLLGYVKGKMMSVVEQLDTDGDRHISKTEFAGILENAQACRALRDVGVDVMGLVDSAENIFLDSTGTRIESLSFHDFMDVVLQLRGSNNATVKDVMELRKMIRVMNNDTTDMIMKLSKRIRRQGEVSFLNHQAPASTSSRPPSSAHCRSSWAHPERSEHSEIALAAEDELVAEGEGLESVSERSGRRSGPRAQQRPTEQLSLDGRWHPFGADAPASSSSHRHSAPSGRAERCGPAAVGWRPSDVPLAAVSSLKYPQRVSDVSICSALGASQAELQTQLDGLSKTLNSSLEEVWRLRAQLLDRPDQGPSRKGSGARQAHFSDAGDAEASFPTGLDFASRLSFKVGSAPSHGERSSGQGIDVAHTVSFKAWGP